MDRADVLIVGGGIIGLSIGWQLARAGRGVVVLDRAVAGRGASWAAGGMLAAAAEVGFEDLELYRLCRESLRRWPGFAQRLEAESGLSVDYRADGTLVVADDADGARALRRVYDFQRQHELPVRWLSGAEALEIEPFLAPRLTAAVHSPEDHGVDNRRVVEALRAALERQGGLLREHAPVRAVEPHETRPAVRLESGERLEGSVVVVAAGAHARGLEGLPPEAQPPVRPVKGQVIELRMERPFELRHVVRGPHAYLVPKSDGRLVIGATSEEMGFDTRVTAGGVYELLEGAWEVVPGIYDLPLADAWAGLRPASRDHAPLVGPSAAPGVFMAAGHYRHGILLSAVTAEEAARMLLTGETSPWLAPFSPRRFS